MRLALVGVYPYVGVYSHIVGVYPLTEGSSLEFVFRQDHSPRPHLSFRPRILNNFCTEAGGVEKV